MSIKKPLVLGDGLPQQLQPQDITQDAIDITELRLLLRQLLISCAIQGIQPLYEELQVELSIAMEEQR